MIIKENTLPPITPKYDPWEAYMDVEQYGKMTLTNIEFTTTTLCNSFYTSVVKYYWRRTDAFKEICSKLCLTSI